VAFLAVQLVDTVADGDQLALLAARQVEGCPPDTAFCDWFGREGAQAVAALGVFRKALSVRGVAPRDVQGVVCEEPGLGRFGRPSGGFSPRVDTKRRDCSRPEDCLGTSHTFAAMEQAHGQEASVVG
jgi:hypothetical protein